jgi:biotin carboxylase
MSEHGVVLLVGSGSQPYREYLLAAAARHRPVWLLDSTEPTWQAPYVMGSTPVELLDRVRLIPDVDRLVKAAGEIAAVHPVAGAFTYDETLVVATAHITEALGLAGPTVAAAENCRDKHRTRHALTAAGLLQPRFAYVTGAEAARAAADSFGYPVMLKPRGMGASMGVIRVENADAVAAAYGIAEAASHEGSPSYEGGALVEEYLTGPEVSVDGAAFDGGYEPFFIAHKRIGLAPFSEETGHLVNGDDPLLHDDDLRRMLATAHRVLGMRDGITHTEVKLTDRGPAIVEVNARLGGDLIPYLGRLATGIEPAHVAMDVALGVRPRLEPARRRSVGIRFCYPPANGTVRRVNVPGPGEVTGLVEAEAMVRPGATLRLPPDGYLARYAYLICAADSDAACEVALDEAAAHTSVVLDRE